MSKPRCLPRIAALAAAVTLAVPAEARDWSKTVDTSEPDYHRLITAAELRDACFAEFDTTGHGACRGYVFAVYAFMTMAGAKKSFNTCFPQTFSEKAMVSNVRSFLRGRPEFAAQPAFPIVVAALKGNHGC